MSNRPTTAQLETLVEFLEQNLAMARGFLRTSQGKQDAKRKWAELAIQLNALGGVSKDGPGWAKYWAEKKCSLKKLCAQHLASTRQTGGGSGERWMLSALDTRLVALMGGTSFASGDSGVIVNPFPQTQSAETSQPLAAHDELVMESEQVLLQVTSSPPPPTPPAAGTSREGAPAAIQTSSTANPRRRPRRLLSRSVDSEMDRMAAIEDRRVEAERLSAEALADTSRRLDNLTLAAEHIAQAISEVASDLRLIGNNLAR